MVFLLTDTFPTFADVTCTHKIPHFNFFTNSFYRVNIGKRAILNKNLGIIGHFLKDREL